MTDCNFAEFKFSKENAFLSILVTISSVLD